MPKEISVSKYAEQKGITVQAVYRAISEGRITARRNAAGKKVIDPDVADSQWVVCEAKTKNFRGDLDNQLHLVLPTDSKYLDLDLNFDDFWADFEASLPLSMRGTQESKAAVQAVLEENLKDVIASLKQGDTGSVAQLIANLKW